MPPRSPHAAVPKQATARERMEARRQNPSEYGRQRGSSVNGSVGGTSSGSQFSLTNTFFSHF